MSDRDRFSEEDERIVRAILPVTQEDLMAVTSQMYLVKDDASNIWANLLWDNLRRDGDVAWVRYLDLSAAVAKRGWHGNVTNQIWDALYARLGDHETSTDATKRQ